MGDENDENAGSEKVNGEEGRMEEETEFDKTIPVEATPVKKALVRPVSEQLLGRGRLKPMYEATDTDATQSRGQPLEESALQNGAHISHLTRRCAPSTLSTSSHGQKPLTCLTPSQLPCPRQRGTHMGPTPQGRELPHKRVVPQTLILRG